MEQNTQITEEKLRAEAIECDRMLTRGLFEILYLVKRMYDRKLYTYLGYSSLEEYCDDRWSMAKRTMYFYLDVADKFLPEDSKVSHGTLFELGISKLKILTALDDNTRSELAVKGELTLDGKSFTIENLKKMSRETLRELVTGEKEEEPELPEDKISFDKAYNRVERHLEHLVQSVYHCPTIGEPDSVEIQKAVKIIINIFDRYKRDEDAMRRIK